MPCAGMADDAMAACNHLHMKEGKKNAMGGNPLNLSLPRGRRGGNARRPRSVRAQLSSRLVRACFLDALD